MAENIYMKWTRPETSEYPRIWYKFEAKDINSDELVEYRIQDLPESRFDEAVELMTINFCRDEPLNAAFGSINDAAALDDYKSMTEILVKQKAALVCFRNGSDQIVGLSINCVLLKDESLFEDLREINKSETRKAIYKVFDILYSEFKPCDHYKVDKYLSSNGIVVLNEYRGRRIGEHFLRARKPFCEAFDIKLTIEDFTSNFSNVNADKVGFQINRSLRIDDIRKNHPELNLPPIKSDVLTLRVWKF